MITILVMESDKLSHEIMKSDLESLTRFMKTYIIRQLKF